MPSTSMLARTVTLEFESTTGASLTDRIASTLRAHGGVVVGRSVRREGASSIGELEVRVPDARLDAALGALRGVAPPTREEQVAEDLTNEFIDSEARLRTGTLLETRLLALAERGGTVKDLGEVEAQLARVRTANEALVVRQRVLENRVRFATVHVRVTAPFLAARRLESTLRWRVEHALSEGSDNAKSVLATLVYVGVTTAPLHVPVLMALGVWVAVRRRRRRQIARTTAAA
ncbi:MAG: DUF4349 domain-containing protein [Polyangiales bacterium]|nr:DUF4349 domain-containing protein [Myxococcales bacterium]